MELKLIRQDEQGLSYYENPDTELVKKIQALPREEKTFNHWSKGFSTVDRELPNGNIMCTAEGGDVFTLTKDEVEEHLSRQHIDKICKEFDIYGFFTKNFLPLKNGSSILHKVENKYPQMMNDGYDSVNPVMQREDWYIVNGCYSMKAERNIGHCSGMLFFNEQGEIVNRDYNYDFNKVHPFKSKEDYINEVVAEFDKYEGKVINHSGTWYLDDYCYIFHAPEGRELYIEKKEKQREGIYYNSGESRWKTTIPKTAEEKSLSDFQDFLRTSFQSFFNIK